jgi:hypothetical protein
MKEPMKCECGFTVEVCATNLCMRKKVHSAGLTPGSKWPEPAPIRNRIKDTATSHEAKPFMMLSCREAGRCLHNLPGCICEVDPCYDVDLRLSAGSERPIAWRRVRDDGVATYWQTEVPDSTPVSISELAKLEADYNEWREAYDRLSAKLPSRAPASNGERGRYSFDDLSIGWTKDGNKIDRKIVPRPPKLSNDGWYQFAGEIIAMLNEPQTAAPPEISRLIAKSDEQTTALDQIMTTAADNLAAANSDLKMTLEFIHHVAEYTLAVTRPHHQEGGK